MQVHNLCLKSINYDLFKNAKYNIKHVYFYFYQVPIKYVVQQKSQKKSQDLKFTKIKCNKLYKLKIYYEINYIIKKKKKT